MNFFNPLHIKKILHTIVNPTKYRADVIHYVDIDDIENVVNSDTVNSKNDTNSNTKQIKNVVNSDIKEAKNDTNSDTLDTKNVTNYDIEEIV